MCLVTIHRVTRAKAKNIWSGVALLGLAIILAFWLVRSSPSLHAQEMTLPDMAQTSPLSLAPLASIAQVTAGYAHTCAVTTTGGVKCWGSNASGQLGDGTMVDKGSPADVMGLGNGVTAVSAGGSHTCALTSAGGVKCWGGGRLGDGTETGKITPVDVVGLDSGVLAISAGGQHICALTTAGRVKCWGSNWGGQVGDSTTTNRLTPVDVLGLSGNVIAISAGANHTCALTTAGGVKCWGYGGVGDGTTETRTTPVDVVGLTSGVVAIAGGVHTCALTTTGGVKCWGNNWEGQVGDGTTTNKSTPVDVVGLDSGVTSIAVYGSHSCALTMSGETKCWGGNGAGELGDGTTVNKSAPVNVAGLGSDTASIAAGGSHTCALTTTGGVKCWGGNGSGQLGNNTIGNKSIPVDVMGLGSDMGAISTSSSHTCAVTTIGEVKCWGNNSNGQLGDGTTASRSTPVEVGGLGSSIAAISTGPGHTCALTTTGGVKCWGRNLTGELGDGTKIDKSSPVDVSGLASGVAAIAVGYYHSCALTTAGGVKCWGNNGYGQLGDGWGNDKLTPVDVAGLSSGVTSIDAAGFYTCALTTAGGVKCWGRNEYGQLGDGTIDTDRTTPVDVVGLGSGVAAIGTAGNHTCAAMTAGGVKCWGTNGLGELGDGTTESRTTPVDVVGLSGGVVAIAGGWHTCALTTAGGVKCWGSNYNGQLGDGTTVSKSTPVDVIELDSGVAALDAAGSHSCALTTSGGIKCWGSNGSGQLGDGTAWRTTPGDVLVEDTRLYIYLPSITR